MIERDVEIVNKYGLHARPATALVNLAGKFKSSIFIRYNNKKVNAKSILGVLVLAAERGAIITIEADGPDEEEAVRKIVELAKNKFGMIEET
jgi:phosphocarrier protein